MIIKEIRIYNKKYEYSCKFDNYTHISSKKNTQGKTTLVRFIIFGFGFNIPITEGVSGDRFTVELTLDIQNIQYKLIRKGNKVDILFPNGSKTFSVTNNNRAVLELLLKNSNPNLLSNVLGTFYIDQESGWVVFNRGTVISGQRFNVDQLIYGLLNIDESLFVKRTAIDKDIKDYTAIIKLHSSQDRLEEFFDQKDPIDDRIQKCQQNLNVLKIELNDHRKRKSSIKDRISKNDKLWKYIDSLQLTVHDNGKDIKITRDNIVGYQDSKDMYDAELYDEDASILKITAAIDELNREIEEYFAIDEVVTDVKILGAKPSYKIDIEQAKINLDLLKQQKSVLQSRIDSKLSTDSYLDSMNALLKKYCDILDVSDILDQNKCILCTDFKRNTGTRKQKLILAYRFTFLKTISDHLGVKLPIIIDSLNRETDSENMEAIIKFIHDEFSDHQIIISSIVELPNNPKIIAIEDRLFKEVDSISNVKKVFDSDLSID
ncbi:MAG: hypothetical protein GX582_02430 [Acholeplasmataceae bacterium]|nr:hypothetical protein [Acholeplasmataceae bacterium]